MGTWGTGIYSNDLAEDVKDACKDVFAFYEVEEGNRKIFEIYTDVLNQKWIDNDLASFWYALADWQWKHGMLTESVKAKALELLAVYAGIEDWIETGNKRDVAKRKKVIELLRAQLQQPQPPTKKPALRLAKPKHKPGDIIVFKATDYVDKWDSAWHIENFRPPFMFESTLISKSKYEDINGYDAHGKYMAILCVGSQKEIYSEYIPDVFDEYSEYVWYDYLSPQKPSVEQLSSCGFLPAIKWLMRDFNKGITESVSWVYHFILTSESFKQNEYYEFSPSDVSVAEVARFYQLFSNKPYPKDYFGGDAGGDLISRFYTMFKEKNRMELLGLQVDNLLEPQMRNPEILPPSEVDKMYRIYKEGLLI